MKECSQTDKSHCNAENRAYAHLGTGRETANGLTLEFVSSLLDELSRWASSVCFHVM